MAEEHRQQTDHALEFMAARGDGDAFAELYGRHSRRVYDFVVRLVKDEEASADIVQDAFLRAMKALKTERQRAKFSTWIFTIAKNLALSHLSTGSRTIALQQETQDDEGSGDSAFYAIDPDQYNDPEEAAKAADLAKIVWSAAGFLNAKESSILNLHVREGMDSAEIAEVLGIKKGYAYTILSRLKQTFEESVVASIMIRNARQECGDLDELLSTQGSALLSPAIRRLVTGHITECQTCQRIRSELLSPSALFGAFAIIPIPAALNASIIETIKSQWDVIGPGAAVAAGGAASLSSGLVERVISLVVHAGRAAVEPIRSITVSWPYQTVMWQAAHVGVGLVVTASIVGGGVIVSGSAPGSSDAGRDGSVLGVVSSPSPTDGPVIEDPTPRATGEPTATPSAPVVAAPTDAADGETGTPIAATTVPPTTVPPTTAPPTTAPPTTAPPTTAPPTTVPPTTAPPTTAPPTTVPPTTAPPITLTMGLPDVTVAAGASVVIPLLITAPAPGVGAYLIDVTFDDGVVAATACAAHSTGVCNTLADSARITGAGFGLSGSVTLAEITFQAIGDPGSCSTLALLVSFFTGPPPEAQQLNPILSNGQICIV